MCRKNQDRISVAATIQRLPDSIFPRPIVGAERRAIHPAGNLTVCVIASGLTSIVSLVALPIGSLHPSSTRR